ncbi:hypothetical protein T484DRAFT_1834742 [Baffinella frigidus]|nr:hypothetical protein T484DRAFT_1834742 [Cryptophyta sp. CCMP2293]
MKLLSTLMATAMVASSTAFAPGLGFLPNLRTSAQQWPGSARGWAAARGMPALRVSMLGPSDVAMSEMSAKVNGVEISTVRWLDFSPTKSVRPPIRCLTPFTGSLVRN